ncbi:hypothetical protein SK069_09940 [Patulibacter brassicae]|uniref:UDP-N-acetyl-alpha-D-muramoyl-L-alanyl-L-glutamate epimerase n=1 Tax=Patulibacter brassicae TaxID=1705717 RepID=A0ABU4VJ91_9ACTN|nr:hypothetical protein [Patulibacter brassicae]MDX8151912.1 hypothetical protein [Patulibacter brassicae]
MPETRPAAAASFDPAAFATFRFVDVAIDEASATVALRYALDDAVTFEETVSFPDVAWPQDAERRAALRRLAGLLHLLAGVSYFKTAAPPTIVLEPGAGPFGGRLTPRLRALLRDVYTLGLGEFAYVNRLDVRERGAWPAADDGGPGDVPRLAPTGRTLVPIGGGKDSVVALEVVQRAGRDAVCFSVGTAGPIVASIAASGRPHALARRTLSPTIGEVNANGALNGHVPVTAIVSTIALMAAVLHGADAVAMANERSASEGNLVWQGLEVNHQWSKGAAFEAAYREVLGEELVAGLDYRSVLRPASELAIARAFSRLERYHPVFTSCNAVFRLDPARRRSNWCGDCPKCRFVFLALAPWLDPPALRAIFGADLLDGEGGPAQDDGFADLAGLRQHKPFECVGEEAESLAAMRLIAGTGPDGAPVPGQEAVSGARSGPSPWAGHAVVARLREEHLAPLDADPAQSAALLAPFLLHAPAMAALPDDLRPAVEAVLGA